ncbi:hypothetical protein [Streptomyces griseus]|uniref:hypothetical protein n=1 Tax=Streptomyces griseus TaxID=1911 RepID=UPI0037A9CF10
MIHAITWAHLLPCDAWGRREGCEDVAAEAGHFQEFTGLVVLDLAEGLGFEERGPPVVSVGQGVFVCLSGDETPSEDEKNDESEERDGSGVGGVDAEYFVHRSLRYVLIGSGDGLDGAGLLNTTGR